MAKRNGLFAGSNPFEIVRRWHAEATETELNDPDAVALATVDANGLPNARMVLLRGIEADSFLFYTNYESVKAAEIESSGKAAFVAHWKSIRRQIRVRGLVSKEDGPKADAYFMSRPLQSRHGAWASKQSESLSSRPELEGRVKRIAAEHGSNPKRPPFWGGYRIRPLEIEFWADGAFRLHDRFRWERPALDADWTVSRLYP